MGESGYGISVLQGIISETWVTLTWFEGIDYCKMYMYLVLWKTKEGTS